jgi:hypothetical protein
MKVRYFALALSGVAALIATTPYANAQITLGPDGAGGWNAYQKVTTPATFNDAHEAAKASTFPGITVGGATIVAADEDVDGHLSTIPNADINALLLNFAGPGWIGLTDNDSTDEFIDLGAFEAGNTSGNPLPPLGSAPDFGQRGEGFVWVDGSPFTYQSWNGGEPNDASGEDAIEMIAGGLWNDLPAGTELGQGDGSARPYSVEYDLNLAEHPVDLDLTLGVKANGLIEGRVVGVVKNGGASFTDTIQWSVAEVVSVPIAGGGTTGEGSLNEVYLTGFWPTGNFWKTLPPLGSVAPPGTPAPSAVWLGLASWSNGTPPYPPEMLAIPGLSANQENYGARASGEIYLTAGDYRFRDGDDDYTLLQVNGQTLIDDTAWTGWSGVDNAFGGVAPGSEVVVTIEEDGWYPFVHAFGEGGGGDNFRLMWDREVGENEEGDDVESPDAPQDLNGELFYTVPTGVMRATIPDAIRVGLALSVDLPDGVFGMGGENGFGTVGGVADLPGSANFANGEEHNLRLTASVLGLTETFDVQLPATEPGGGGGIPPLVLLGDINQDGEVGLADFNILKTNFGATEAGAAVPEPSTVILLGLGGLVGLVSYLRRRK